MAAIDALKEILDKLHKEDGLLASGVISRNGIPIVCNLPLSSQADTFSTLSATILGAGEVVFAGIGKEKPSLVFLSSNSGNMLCTPISPKSLLVLVAEKKFDELMQIAEKAKNNIREVLANEQKV